MDKFIIKGGTPLKGEISISGAKNAVLPIMAATIIKPAIYKIKNVPNLRDTRTMISILKGSGAKVDFNKNILIIDSRFCDNPEAPYELVKTMRASFYMLGPFMSRFNEALISLPGGCAWGPRPVNYHIEALKKMGAKVDLIEGNIICKGKLKGARISFKQKSVGATGNIIMAACNAIGITEIKNAACEPEIVDLCNFLKITGVEIEGVGTSHLYIKPNKSDLKEFKYRVIPDRVEAGTFMIGAFMTKGDVLIKNIVPNHLQIVIDKILEAGAKIDIINQDILRIRYDGLINPVDMETKEFPGYPTDLQAQWMSLMSIARGSCSVKESIYKDRFTHISELVRLGADINLKNNVAYINGVNKLNGAPVMSTDIRASASLILGALAADGQSSISRIYHIDRGYERIENKIEQLGGFIKRQVD